MVRRELRGALEGELGGRAHHAIGVEDQRIAEADPQVESLADCSAVGTPFAGSLAAAAIVGHGRSASVEPSEMLRSKRPANSLVGNIAGTRRLRLRAPG